jgi:aspartate/methionine/tyrosine aminotransferase
MIIKFPNFSNSPLLLIIIFIINFYILIVFCNKNDKLESNKQIQNETIISNIAEPYFIEDSISPLNIELTSDKSGQNGGLSYLTNHTNKKNIQFVHDFIKNDYNFILPKDTEIIFGAGTTMLIAALYYALGKKLQKSITITTNTSVYYNLHEKISKLLKNIDWTNKVSADLSVIVSPSNPLGIITDPKEIKNKYMLYDVVYDKPIFTGSSTSR